ncbi:TonB-dependent receptor plug domain-containing protein [Erythrobacter sp. W53]|uniref:TonB-dependent receptor plug domain-containing protein n=1 Tax=Erythrobacter sp. W53 TaxID=3425947 RepID=UPI003D768B42
MYKYLLLIGSAVISVPAMAQDDPLTPEVERTGFTPQQAPPTEVSPLGAESLPITVTANGISTSLRNTGQPITVIDQDEIDSIQGADIARVLQRAPSVSINRTGSIGAVSGISVRGANAEQLLVLIDGVRVADPSSPANGYDFGNLLSANISKIDLLRGSNSTIWGADAVGGVLNISTRDVTGLASSLEYGARETITTSVTGGVSTGGLYAGLNASAFRTDGFSSAASGREADGFEQFTLGGSAFVDVTPELELFANARYAEGDLEIDGFPAPLFALADTLDTQETEQFSGAVGFAYYGQDLTLRGSFSLSDTERVNLNDARAETFTSDGESERVELRGEYRLIGGLSVAFGGEHEWSRFETLFSAGAETDITGVYGQLGWVMGDLAVHAGVRHDDHGLFGGATSFGGDISYGLGGEWRVRASVGEGFKAPSLFQLLSDFGNSALQPEQSTSYDIGVEHGSRGRGVHFSATLYRRDSENLIAFVSCFGSTEPFCTDPANPRPFGTFDNTQSARAQGIELEAGFDLTDSLRLSGVYALLDAEDRTTGNDLARRPGDLVTIFADYEAPFGLKLGADLRIVGSAFDDAANAVTLEAYEVFDIRAAMPLTDEVELFGRVENIFDVDYQTAFGFASAGRGVFVGVRAGM